MEYSHIDVWIIICSPLHSISCIVTRIFARFWLELRQVASPFPEPSHLHLDLQLATTAASAPPPPRRKLVLSVKAFYRAECISRPLQQKKVVLCNTLFLHNLLFHNNTKHRYFYYYHYSVIPWLLFPISSRRESSLEMTF